MSERREIASDTHIERDEDGGFCLRDVRGEWFWLTQAAGEHLWEAAAPLREDGEGDVLDKIRAGWLRLHEDDTGSEVWRDGWKQINDALGFEESEDGLPQPPASDTEGSADEWTYEKALDEIERRDPQSADVIQQHVASIAAEARRDLVEELQGVINGMQAHFDGRGSSTAAEVLMPSWIARLRALAASPEEARNKETTT